VSKQGQYQNQGTDHDHHPHPRPSFTRLLWPLSHHSQHRETSMSLKKYLNDCPYWVFVVYQKSQEAHRGQTRRGGEPYFNHCEDAAERVLEKGLLENWDTGTLGLRVALALAHDTAEDTSIDIYMWKDILEKANAYCRGDILDNFLTGLSALTKYDGQDYQAYLEGVKKHDDALIVKFKDIASNLYDKPTLKQMEKYSKALSFLVSKE